MSLGKKSEHGIVEKNIVLGKMFNYCTWGKSFSLAPGEKSQYGTGGKVLTWHFGTILNMTLWKSLNMATEKNVSVWHRVKHSSGENGETWHWGKSFSMVWGDKFEHGSRKISTWH